MLPAVTEYTPDEQKALAAELDCKARPVTCYFLKGYKKMRDETRLAIEQLQG